MASAIRGNAIVVGIPESIRAPLERRLKGVVDVRVVTMKKDGGYQLALPPRQAADLIETFAQWIPTFSTAQLLLLPYAKLPSEVLSTAGLLEELGMTVVRPKANSDSWPASPVRMDKTFQDLLLDTICNCIERNFPAAQGEEQDEMVIACEIIRGLVTHSKLGPNNHSHEDDMWKSRGNSLGPGGRDRITDWLLSRGILARKKNASAGGTGWVYWIADAPKAQKLFPTLAAYFT